MTANWTCPIEARLIQKVLPFLSIGGGTFYAKKTNRWRVKNLDFDQNWTVYWKNNKQFIAKFSNFS
jgi:hypothetical protein